MTSALKNAREKAGIAIEDVAKKLKIRRKYLIALEEDRPGDIPGDVYAQGYLKMYTTYLGVDLSDCHVFSASDSSSFWTPGSERIAKYGTYKASISLFLIGILSIFCWYSITEKVIPDSETSIIDKLSKYDAREESGELSVIDSSIVDTALGYIPIEESK